MRLCALDIREITHVEKQFLAKKKRETIHDRGRQFFRLKFSADFPTDLPQIKEDNYPDQRKAGNERLDPNVAKKPA